jgi:flagellar protein FlaG
MTPINVNPIAGVSQLAEKAAPSAPNTVSSTAARRAPTPVVQDQARPAETEQVEALDLKTLAEAIDRIQESVDLQNRSLQFKIDAPNNRVQILVIDRDTEEVIREIPPTEVLKVAERIRETLGLVFDAEA